MDTPDSKHGLGLSDAERGPIRDYDAANESDVASEIVKPAGVRKVEAALAVWNSKTKWFLFLGYGIRVRAVLTTALRSAPMSTLWME